MQYQVRDDGGLDTEVTVEVVMSGQILDVLCRETRDLLMGQMEGVRERVESG